MIQNKNDQIIKYKRKIKESHCKEHNYYKKISNIRKYRESIETKMYNICDHKWTIDHDECGEHTIYYCKICNMQI
jgi:hypothetical protein